MNNQNIFKSRRTKLDGKFDNSELYDYELVDNLFHKLDAVLDSSEYYDYDLGENTTDFVYRDVVVVTFYLLTESGLVLTTEDNYRLRYD